MMLCQRKSLEPMVSTAMMVEQQEPYGSCRGMGAAPVPCKQATLTPEYSGSALHPDRISLVRKRGNLVVV